MFLFLLFLLAVFGIFMDPSALNRIALGIIVINLVIVYFVVWKTAYIMTALTFVINVFSRRFISKEFSKNVLQKAENFSQAVKKVFTSDQKQTLMLLTFTIVILRNIFVLSMIRSMGVTISVWFIVYLFLFLFVTRFVQGFGSFGNQEAGISGALILMGYAKADALAIAIGTHLLQWIPILILGVVSYIGIQRSK